MSHHDLALLTIGFLVGVVGASIVAWVRSASYDRWAEGCAQEADHAVTHPSFAHELTAHEYEHPHVSMAFEVHTAQAIQVLEEAQASTRRLSSVAPVVPIQRDGGLS